MFSSSTREYIYYMFDRAPDTKRQQQKDTAMEVVEDICESEQPEHGESMETHVSEEEAACMANSALPEEHADLSGTAHSNGNTSIEQPKPRYSYRLVCKQDCCKALDILSLY